MRDIAVVGPTASGKTRRAVDIALALDAEIVSADSRQVYRGMDIGTGKDIAEYGDVPVHLLDVADAGVAYNLHRYLADARQALDDIHSRGKRAVVCGGSGMYVENLLAGIVMPEVPENPELRKTLSYLSLDLLRERLQSMKRLHNVTDVDTKARAIRAIEIEDYYLRHPEQRDLADRKKATPLDAVVIGVDIDRDSRRRKITDRLRHRLEKENMLDEIRKLLDSGISPEKLIYYGLEYKYLTLHVIGELSYDEMFRQLETAIHQFAKRQMTWFRGMERRGFKIHWIPAGLSTSDFLDRVLHLV